MTDVLRRRYLLSSKYGLPIHLHMPSHKDPLPPLRKYIVNYSAGIQWNWMIIQPVLSGPVFALADPFHSVTSAHELNHSQKRLLNTFVYFLTF